MRRARPGSPSAFAAALAPTQLASSSSSSSSSLTSTRARLVYATGGVTSCLRSFSRTFSSLRSTLLASLSTCTQLYMYVVFAVATATACMCVVWLFIYEISIFKKSQVAPPRKSSVFLLTSLLLLTYVNLDGPNLCVILLS